MITHSVSTLVTTTKRWRRWWHRWWSDGVGGGSGSSGGDSDSGGGGDSDSGGGGDSGNGGGGGGGSSGVVMALLSLLIWRGWKRCINITITTGYYFSCYPWRTVFCAILPYSIYSPHVSPCHKLIVIITDAWIQRNRLKIIHHVV